jgi:hypothetical protein
MSLTIELTGSQRGQAATGRGSEIELHYLATGQNLMADAVAAVIDLAPGTYADPVWGLVLEMDEVNWTPVARDKWHFTVRYVDPTYQDSKKQIETGEYTISFDTTGATSKITTSLSTVNSYTADPADPPQNFKGTIGVTGERDVEGCERIVPQQRFTVSYRQPRGIITVAYAATLELLTGTVNDDTFFGRPAGEVLFAGASGKQGNKSDPTIEYHFLRMPSLSNYTVGQIGNIDKKGWEHIWFTFKDEKLPNFIRRVPRWAYVEKVYPDGDFTLLGIGTGT